MIVMQQPYEKLCNAAVAELVTKARDHEALDDE